MIINLNMGTVGTVLLNNMVYAQQNHEHQHMYNRNQKQMRNVGKVRH